MCLIRTAHSLVQSGLQAYFLHPCMQVTAALAKLSLLSLEIEPKLISRQIQFGDTLLDPQLKVTPDLPVNLLSSCRRLLIPATSQVRSVHAPI